MTPTQTQTPLPTPEPERLTRQPKNQAQGHSDHFQTPASALEPLLSYLRPEWTIWEPACGSGNLVWGLAERGYAVIKSDLLHGAGYDFLRYAPPQPWDALVTNPPYSIKDEWITQCYRYQRPFALLLPYTALEGKRRQALYRRYGVEILFFDWRVDFETPNGPGSSAWFPTMWLCHRILPEPIVFAERQKL